MLITHECMKQINNVQVEILRAVSDVCKKLDIKYYMIHGSLLGTIRNNHFVPDDDDIDIALFREDYETFCREAPKYLPSHYFVQSHTTDPAYPLEFGKVRDSRTTYIVEIARHLPINHGIYIDVFPIDYYPDKSGFTCMLLTLKYRLLKTRIKSVWKIEKINYSCIRKLADFVSLLYCPSVTSAIKRLNNMLQSEKMSNKVRVSGGKVSEQGIPKKWFLTARESMFEGITVYIPDGYHDYLTKVYGDYVNRTLVENKISDEHNIEVNACIVDINKPYTEFLSKQKWS